MSTFSQMVDELAAEHLRPDMRTRGDIQEYLNQTIRELHQKRAVNGANMDILFESNRVEFEWTVPSPLPAVWDIPSVPRFQRLETVYYKELGVYSKKRHPSRAFQNGLLSQDPYWYRSGAGIVFSGIDIGLTVKMSYFLFPPRLKYYADATPQIRPAVYDYEADSYLYATAYDVDDDSRQAARDLSTNWILLRWHAVVKEGVRAKIFKRQGEIERAKLCFSAFESLREGMHSSEAFEENT